eukprot:m.49631 g.49631  ORF g.49631 m.49631 type:complete len:52 (+) comp17940_c1_seq1:249-404(+)
MVFVLVGLEVDNVLTREVYDLDGTDDELRGRVGAKRVDADLVERVVVPVSV